MKTILNIKVDKEVKEEAFKVAEEMGVPLSTLANAMLKKLIQERSVTFVAPLRPSKKLMKILRQGEKDLKEGKNLSPAFADMEEMNVYMEKQLK